MKKVVLLLLALLSVLLLAVGCGGSQNDDNLPALESVTLNAKGVLSWEAVAEAQEYKVVISDGTNVGEPKTVTENKFDLLSAVTQAGSYTASIKAYAGTSAVKAGDFAFTAVKLGTPSKPVLETDSVTHLEKFVWQSNDTNTRNYLQSINDGKWVTNSEGFYEISATGSYYISVKAKAYANGKVLYLESDASERSETVGHLQGPVLRVESMNVIKWSADTDFDAYNLWINGQKAKENVVCGSEGYNLITGADPAITKTGEYNLQIEAIKDGESYFSNILEEVGTHNINENELYSFDNRKANFNQITQGFRVSISDEQYHGDGGYSLRMEVTQSAQLNFIKYAYEGFRNDIDYSRIKKISYWVYVPSIAGYEGATFPASGLPRWKWEKGDWKTDEGTTYKQTWFAASEDIPFDTWTKVEIDNVENIKSQEVFIMSIFKVLEQDCVIYVDDIRYEELYAEDAVTDAEYVVEFNPAAVTAGSWNGYNYTTIDLGAGYANQTVAVAMDVCGTANANAGTESVGFFFNIEPDADPTDYYRICIDAAKISSTSAWNQIILSVNTDAEGKAYCTGMLWRPLPDGVTPAPYKIYVKNVTVIDGTAMTAGGANNTGNGYYQSYTGLKTNLEVGTAVTVEMDVFVTGTFNEYSYIDVVKDVWSVAGGESKDGTSITSTIITGDSGWHHVTFTATVKNFSALRMNTQYEVQDTSAIGNAVYLIVQNRSESSFNYKNVTITAA